MHAPLINLLVSSPYGDVPADADKLHLPMECDPLRTSYKVYFQAIRDFLEKDEFSLILRAAGKKCGEEVELSDLSEIIVRTEKHGSLCHPASVELVLKEKKMKFGLNVAVTETGRMWLKEEFMVISEINVKFNLPYLPRVYCFEEQNSISFLLEEWFEGYHEFHLSMTEDGTQGIKLWEYGKGYKFLAPEQSFEIYRQASKILTLYYDINDFSQIFPWHHSAGDFIAKVDDEGVDLHLTTARRYEPYMVFRDEEGINPVLALFFFLLNLTVRMRLDKLDGVGETVWADDFALGATLKGFREALGAKTDLKGYFDSADAFSTMLKSFSIEDLKAAYHPLVDVYQGTADYSVITANLDGHVRALHATLQDFPL